MESFEGETMELLACGRVVEKIGISFATRAKRVDVRQLKSALWRTIESERERGEPAVDFATLVHKVSQTHHQADATMPFHFICLLHLCNEKTLALENSADGDISDFKLKFDAD